MPLWLLQSTQHLQLVGGRGILELHDWACTLPSPHLPPSPAISHTHSYHAAIQLDWNYLEVALSLRWAVGHSRLELLLSLYGLIQCLVHSTGGLRRHLLNKLTGLLVLGTMPELGAEQTQATWGPRLVRFEETSEAHN